MKPAPFTYHAPRELEEALALLAQYGDDAKVLAGGQSLVPLLALRLASPPVLVDIGRIASLGHSGLGEHGAVTIGANCTQRFVELNSAITGAVPVLGDALQLIAHPQIRNRGTLCGSLAHGDPAAELPAVALALGATMAVHSVRGQRTLDADSFFESYLETALHADEILSAVIFRAAGPGEGSAFSEISRRQGDFAIAGAAVSVRMDGAGLITEANISLSGVASTPVRVPTAEALLRGQALDDELLAQVAVTTSAALDPPDDIHATASYRRHISGVVVRRALTVAVARATKRTERP